MWGWLVNHGGEDGLIRGGVLGQVGELVSLATVAVHAKEFGANAERGEETGESGGRELRVEG